MVLSSRDRRLVDVYMVWLGPSLERRRLRFSFQFNDFKDQTDFRRPHCLAPVVGGGGCLEAGLFSVNRSFRIFFWAAAMPKSRAKTALGPPRGFPHQSSDSIGAGTLVVFGGKSKEF